MEQEAAEAPGEGGAAAGRRRRSGAGGSAARARSAADQLVNATARAIVQAHSLMTDRSALDTRAPPDSVARYLREVDSVAASLLRKCKVAVPGGFNQPACESCLLSLS